MDKEIFSDIFSITKIKKAPKLQTYRVIFPCGSMWEFNRSDLEIPEFKDGEQTGVTYVYETNKEAIADLTGMGYTVERLS